MVVACWKTEKKLSFIQPLADTLASIRADNLKLDLFLDNSLWRIGTCVTLVKGGRAYRLGVLAHFNLLLYSVCSNKWDSAVHVRQIVRAMLRRFATRLNESKYAAGTDICDPDGVDIQPQSH